MSTLIPGIVALMLTSAGLFAGVFSLLDALHERRVAKAIGGVRLIYACSTVRSQSFRATKLLALSILAVNFVTQWSPDGARRNVNITLLLLVTGLTALDAVLDRIVSHKIVHHLLNELDGEHEHLHVLVNEPEDQD